METARPRGLAPFAPARVTNPDGASPFVIVCDHASNFVPAAFASLGLSPDDLARHIAWDPGALAVARRMAEALDATLVESCVSRLVVDCNRPLDAPDLISEVSETTRVPGNAGLSASQREARVALAWRPFHEIVAATVERRLAAGRETRLVSIHSFTPRYKGVARPWHVGVIHDEDMRLAAPMIAALGRLSGVSVGVNQPYSPADRVYFTLERHARSRDLPCVMIEIRNDEVADGEGQARWGGLLAEIFGGIAPGKTASAARERVANA